MMVAIVSEIGSRHAPHTYDGFTAVFAAPVAYENHAQRVVLAALELQQRLRQYPAMHTHTPEGGLAVRMGLHSGLVIGGDLGNAPQRLYTAVGDPTSLATRLLHRAVPGTIHMSAATYRLVHEEVQVEACQSCDFDARPMPVHVYALLGLLRRDAIHAAVTLPWCQGPIERHINRLKLLKRRKFGRARLDLLARHFLLAV